MNINDTVLTEIQKQHRECKRLINEARSALKAATSQAVKVAALAEKAQRHHKSSIHTFLSPIMSGVESRAYLATSHAAKTRDVSADKRILQSLTILPKAPPRKSTGTSRTPKSLNTKIARANADISKSIEQTPVSDMPPAYRAMLKESMKPLAELYLSLASSEIN